MHLLFTSLIPFSLNVIANNDNKLICNIIIKLIEIMVRGMVLMTLHRRNRSILISKIKCDTSSFSGDQKTSKFRK